MQPNLLFLMTDQQRFDALGANGNSIIKTPNLDSLAAEGVNVRNYYTNCPVCVPSRCTLFTGRYPHSHGVRENHNLLEAGREIHLFRALKRERYKLGYVGKNHLLEGEEFANFDYTDVWNLDHEMSPGEQEVHDFARGRGKPMREIGVWAGATWHDYPEQHTRPYVRASSAQRFIEQQSGDEPFCLCVSFSDPHAPHIAPRKFEAMYPLEAMEPYPYREGELAEKARRFVVKQQVSQADKADDEQRRRFMAVYYSMISWVDEQIGRVLTTLRERGLDENTIIVFTSDHGEFCFEHGMCKKDLVLLDSLLHVPLLVRYPKRLEPAVFNSGLCEEVDLMPTLLELMDVEIPFGVQGRSFLACLTGQRDVHKTEVYGEICPPWLRNSFPTREAFVADWKKSNEGPPPFNVPGDYCKSLRDEAFGYVWYATGEEELYDLSADPHEQHNVAADPAYGEALNDCRLRLGRWHMRSEDPLDPLSVRQLQRKYVPWRTAQMLPGGLAGPGWLDQRFRDDED